MYHDEDTEYCKYENGTTYRYFGGVLHCEDGPAIIRPGGVEEWYYNGRRHRVGGPAVIRKYRCEWYCQNKLHREDGPAIELVNGDKFWYINDELHRIDGPAYERHSIGIIEWYIRGKRLTDDEANFLKFCANK